MRLPRPRTAPGREAVAALEHDRAGALLAMDFDGTLAPIVADPSLARAHPRAGPVLRQLAPLVGRLAIITGRPAQVAVDYAGTADVDNLVVLGHYGTERWQEGSVVTPAASRDVERVRARLADVLAHIGAPEGTLVEDKGHGLAVHVRQTPDPAAALDLLAQPIRMLALDHGLVVEPGRMVLELRPAGMDKGVALRRLVEEGASGRPYRVVVFIGDDLGDLAAFDEVERLRSSGLPGLLVCSGSAEVPEVAQRADLVVDGPDGVVDWLHALAASAE